MNHKEFKLYFETQWEDFIHSEYHGTYDLDRACKYALEGKGKRTRPILIYLAAKAINPDIDIHSLMIPCFAVEMIHNYSLVHDDLPIFDDDSMRRGRPTVHTIYGQPNAVLAGDALLSDAWGLLTQNLDKNSITEMLKRIEIIKVLSNACGSKGMVLGQFFDISWTNQKTGYKFDDLTNLHERKTGDLIAASCMIGAIIAGGSHKIINSFQKFGLMIGLVFQIIDDILDNSEHTGKTPGKDSQQEKLTFLRIMSLQEAKQTSQNLTKKAIRLLEESLCHSSELQDFVRELLNRKT